MPHSILFMKRKEKEPTEGQASPASDENLADLHRFMCPGTGAAGER